MYLPYENIGKIVSMIFPEKYKKTISDFFMELKTSANCRYIKKNQKKVLKKLRHKYKKEPIRVAFVCFEASKWKCQSLYELLSDSEYFHPFILITKNNAPQNSSKPMTAQEVSDTYKFFKEKGLETFLAFDLESQRPVPVKEFEPDIIFYQQPWYIFTSQGPVVASKFALTCYVPYFVANVSSYLEYGLRFHRYLYKHYILNKLIFDFYSKNMENNGKNLRITGHTQLDYFYLNREKIDKTEKRYVIYAPHWSINYPPENYATFEWNAREILEFAKKHREIEWIFKPHPILKHRLKTQNIMSAVEIENYWGEWAKIGFVHENGDYMDIFSKTRVLITDCGSFLTEFFLTKQPVIHLVSEKSYPYNPSAEKIVQNYYSVRNTEELKNILELVVLKREDPMREQRENAINELGFKDVFAAKNILKDIEADLLTNDTTEGSTGEAKRATELSEKEIQDKVEMGSD